VKQNTVRFDGSASLSTKGKVVAYEWDFGDGTTATEARPQHAYTSEGEYPVKLMVTDDTGLKGRVTKTVRIYSGQPVAEFQFWPDHSQPGEAVGFDASQSLSPKGQLIQCDWTFGDGTTGNGPVVRHTYASAGDYTVTLTVWDDKGKTARQEQKVAIINPEAKKVIYETDMCLDVDDVGGLATLHALADRGEAEILAVCFNEVHPSGAAAIDAVNTWYGRGDIPVGVYKDPLFEPDYSGYLEVLASFPHDLNHERAASALETYREVLSNQPDRSVTIISVGFLNNLSDLLIAEPMLVEQKVKELVIMGGLTNDGFNLSRHRLVSASQNVIENWPTPLVISGAGSSILTGTTLQAVSAENPVRTAYYAFFGSNYCARPSWDQMAVLYGVRGATTYFEKITSGKGLLPNGYTWQMKPGVRSYLKTRLSEDTYGKVIEDLMTVPPSIRAEEFRKLPVNTYIDKMKAGWLGQMVGVGYAGPTEFKWKGEIIRAESMPKWKPEMVNQFVQDDIYVEMTFLKTLEDYGLDCSIRQAGIDFANSEYRLWHANLYGRNNLRSGIAPPDSGHP
jgi:chitodextrinase